MTLLPQLTPFRSITALLLAFLVAVPLCCCSLEAADAPARQACCAGGENQGDEKGPQACACKSKEPRDEAKIFEFRLDQVAAMVPTVQDLGYLSQPLLQSEPMAGMSHSGCDPPRLRLAWYSRWLI
ncbi:hypothetical protein [Haloferula sp.]|uniref:hypothetical protein n=1 Tax=Haloferula sp. TaxID=2497595 RepID=UPI003C7584B3